MQTEAIKYFGDESRILIIKRLISDGWLPPTISRYSIHTSAAATPFIDPELIRIALMKLIALRTWWLQKHYQVQVFITFAINAADISIWLKSQYKFRQFY
jgi:hypothetical protein